jgi:hypothetical protein
MPTQVPRYTVDQARYFPEDGQRIEMELDQIFPGN